MTDTMWRTSVNELVGTFKEAATSLLPSLRSVRIPTGVHVGTDAWEEITEPLFKHIVVESIRWSLPEPQIEEFEMPRYEMTYDSYDRFSGLIEVIAWELNAGPEIDRFVFHSLKPGSEGTNLDVVVAFPVSQDSAVSERPVEVPYSHCKFRCLIRRPDGATDAVQSIAVAL